MIIGCAMYVDALKSPSLLSLVLQEGNSSSAGDKEHSQVHKRYPVNGSARSFAVAYVVSRISDDDDQQKLYQGSVLTQYSSSMLSSLIFRN